MRTIAFAIAIASGLNTFLDPLGRAQIYGQALNAISPLIEALDIAGPDSSDDSKLIEQLREAVADYSAKLRAKAVAQQPITVEHKSGRSMNSDQGG